MVLDGAFVRRIEYMRGVYARKEKKRRVDLGQMQDPRNGHSVSRRTSGAHLCSGAQHALRFVNNGDTRRPIARRDPEGHSHL